MWLTLAEMGWPELLDRYGYPTVGLVIVLVGLTYFSRVAWRDIVIPLRDKFIGRIDKFFNRMEATLDRSEGYHTGHADALARQEDLLWRIEGIAEEVDDKCTLLLANRDLEYKPTGHRRARPRPGKPPHPPPSGGTSGSTSPSSP